MPVLASSRLRAAQAGISLVETLVALVLGLAMVSVAFNLYVSNRAVFGQIEAMVRLQESASIATALLEAEIRQVAGTLCRKNPVTTVLVRGPSTRSIGYTILKIRNATGKSPILHPVPRALAYWVGTATNQPEPTLSWELIA